MAASAMALRAYEEAREAILSGDAPEFAAFLSGYLNAIKELAAVAGQQDLADSVAVYLNGLANL